MTASTDDRGDEAELVELRVIPRGRTLTAQAAFAAAAALMLVAGGVLLALRPGAGATSAEATSTAIASLLTRDSAARPTAPGTSEPTPRLQPWLWQQVSIVGLGGISEVWALPSTFVARVELDLPRSELPTETLIASRSGTSWARVAMPSSEFVIEAATVADDVLWMIGWTGSPDNPRRAFWFTSDLLQWTRVGPVDGLLEGTGRVVSITHAAPGWVAVVETGQAGSSGSPELQLRFSLDGLAWMTPDLPYDADGIESIAMATDGARWVAVIEQDRDAAGSVVEVATLRSADGRTWTGQEVAHLPGRASDIAFGPGGYVIVGEEYGRSANVPRVWRSGNGRGPWEVVGIDGAGDRTPVGMFRVTAADHGYLAISASSGESWISPDGTTWLDFQVWVRRVGTLRDVALLDGTIVAAGQNSLGEHVVLVGDMSLLRR